MTMEVTEYQYSPCETGIKLENQVNGSMVIIPREDVINVIRDILKTYDEIY